MGRILDAIYSVPPTETSGARCKVGSYLDSLPPEDADDLLKALTLKIGDKYAASGARLAIALGTQGIDLSASIIQEHRAHLCRCYRVVATNG